VVTGANGSGKSTLLNGVAAAGGLGDRYSSSKTTYQYSGLEKNEAEKTYGGVALIGDDGEPVEFDRVIRFRGEETRKSPIAMDTMEDMELIFGSQGSHGEVTQRKLGKALMETMDVLEANPDERLLLLLDEPEAGLGLDFVMAAGMRISEICKQAMTSDNFRIVIVTQNPFMLVAALAAKATRIDLGGWLRDFDPYEVMVPLAEQTWIDVSKKVQSGVRGGAKGATQ